MSVYKYADASLRASSPEARILSWSRQMYIVELHNSGGVSTRDPSIAPRFLARIGTIITIPLSWILYGSREYVLDHMGVYERTTHSIPIAPRRTMPGGTKLAVHDSSRLCSMDAG